MKGAPIRFVVAVVGGWTCVRIAVLLPEVEPLALAGDVLATPAQAAGRQEPRIATTPTIPPGAVPEASPGAREKGGRTAKPRRREPVATREAGDGAIPARPRARPEAVAAVLVPTTFGPVPGPATSRRWSASTWLLARGGSGGTLSGGQLGASQAGVRVLYRIDGARRLALAARIAAPLRGRGAEAAIGVDWQPTAVPVHIVAEQRVGLDGADGGPTAMVIAGLNPTPMAAGFRLEAYAQAGAILRDGRAEAFGDGALRLVRPVASVGRATLDIGIGAWAAGQRGAARADVGPSIGLAVPVAGRGVRLSLDWRQRVAGRARPGSGPALSIGSDF